MKNTRLVLGFLLGAVIFLSAGCSEKDGKQAGSEKDVANATQLPKEEQVRLRVQGRWDALIAMDWEKAYSYFSPGSRELKSLSVFRGHMLMAPIKRLSIKIKKIECSANVCQTELELRHVYTGRVEAMRGQISESLITEKWFYSDENWWYVDPSNH
jgi:hypothetical protein